MHTGKTAYETVNFLWNNYLITCEQVDLESMSLDKIKSLAKQKALRRPFRIAAWAARQGFFIAVWSVWEYYARTLCDNLTNKEKRADSESTVAWVNRSLSANTLTFSDFIWFDSANCLRNLIAHSGARVEGLKGQNSLTRSRVAFPGIDTWQDGYVNLLNAHVARLKLKIEDFISETT